MGVLVQSRHVCRGSVVGRDASTSCSVSGGRVSRHARGNERRRIFRDVTDYRGFLQQLALAVDRYCWLCHGYCLMGNHYHLLVETPRANLPIGMRHLNGCHTRVVQPAVGSGRSSVPGSLQSRAGGEAVVPAGTDPLRRAQPDPHGAAALPGAGGVRVVELPGSARPRLCAGLADDRLGAGAVRW